METITYLIKLVDNIDNATVSSSILYPYFPPTSPELAAGYLDDRYVFSVDTTQYLIEGGQGIPTRGLRIRTQGYEDRIVNPLPQDVAQPTAEGVIDLGIYVLKRIQADTDKEVQILTTPNADEVLNNTQKSQKISGMDKLASILEDRAIELKSLLVQGIVSQVTQFGISNIESILSGKTSIDKLPYVCPTVVKIEKMITLKNKYSKQLSTFYQTTEKLSKALTGTTKVVTILNATFEVISASRVAANIALGLLPVTPGAAPAAINAQKDLQDAIGPKLSALTKGVQGIQSTIIYVAGILNVLTQLLKLLDTLIQKCCEKQQIPYEVVNQTMSTFSPGLISNLQNPDSDTTNTYKGFKFEVVLDATNESKYPKRYAVAKDKLGVITLKGESSFTPNPDILIQELKYIIDRDNLSAE